MLATKFEIQLISGHTFTPNRTVPRRTVQRHSLIILIGTEYNVVVFIFDFVASRHPIFHLNRSYSMSHARARFHIQFSLHLHFTNFMRAIATRKTSFSFSSSSSLVAQLCEAHMKIFRECFALLVSVTPFVCPTFGGYF